MDKDKGVRKYGRRERAVRWGKYLLHLLTLLSVKLLAGVLILAGCAGLFYIGWLSAELEKHRGGADDLYYGRVALLMFGLAIGSTAFLKYFYSPARKGTILHPLPPEENPLLPDADLLVRASSASAAQPAELLRAAQETTEHKPGELLRLVE